MRHTPYADIPREPDGGDAQLPNKRRWHAERLRCGTQPPTPGVYRNLRCGARPPAPVHAAVRRGHAEENRHRVHQEEGEASVRAANVPVFAGVPTRRHGFR